MNLYSQSYNFYPKQDPPKSDYFLADCFPRGIFFYRQAAKGAKTGIPPQRSLCVLCAFARDLLTDIYFSRKIL